jgi:hypothetical protein
MIKVQSRVISNKRLNAALLPGDVDSLCEAIQTVPRRSLLVRLPSHDEDHDQRKSGSSKGPVSIVVRNIRFSWLIASSTF